MAALELTCLAGLAGVHLVAGRLPFLDGIPRSRWLSLAGGIAIAYVFVHLLPDLAEADDALAEAEVVPYIERHAYVMALAGLAVFYALEWIALRARPAGSPDAGEDAGGARVLWLHAASYGAYNGLIGHLVADGGDRGGAELVLFSIAIGVHFVVADLGLRRHHRDRYDAVVRRVLAGALVVGFVTGLVTALSEAALGVLLAFVAGAVILDTLKEEVPSERQSRLAPFLAGAAGYAALLLAV